MGQDAERSVRLFLANPLAALSTQALRSAPVPDGRRLCELAKPKPEGGAAKGRPPAAAIDSQEEDD